LSVQSFTNLGINELLGRALQDVGYEQPTPIQSAAIPSLLEGRDLLGVAQTGTGKTAAFALPLLQKLHTQDRRPKPKCPRALILAPTRELAIQIGEELEAYARYTKLKHVVIFGGVGQNPQVKKLAAGLDIVVATPGRLLDLASQRHLDLSSVETLVLDEADRLLDMGFIRDVKRIVQQTPSSRQSLLFSATMPKEVAGLAASILRDPLQVDVSPKERTVRAITQHVVHLAMPNKQRALEMILHDPSCSRAIVFTRTKHAANRVTKKLINAGISAEAIHGNKSQNARQRSLQAFKQGDAWVLVATDIAARGIDIDGVTHVVNFELPHEPESYVHRIGRTGRAGAEGIAWSLVDPSERPRLKAIERLAKLTLQEVKLDLPPVSAEDRQAEKDDDRPRRQPSKRPNGNRQGNRGGNRGGNQGGNHQGSGGNNNGPADAAGAKPKGRRRRRPASAAS
jgi:ATP-dependent RNA helicase RhlE